MLYSALISLNEPKSPNLLPLRVEVVVNLLVGDGHHDDQDPQEHDTDQELVDHPHGHHRVL